MLGQLTGVPDVLISDLHQSFGQVVLGACCGCATRPPALVLFEITHVLYVACQRYLHVTEQGYNLKVLFKCNLLSKFSLKRSLVIITRL